MSALKSDTELRPFYFTVVFWGDVHRNYFKDLLVASLLAPGNIPSLRRERNSKFLITTTKPDWDKLVLEPLFALLSEFVEPVFLEIPVPGPDDHKMRVMSAGHKIIAQRCFEDRAYGIWLTPDVIISDNSVRHLEELIERGVRVALCVAIRFEHDGLCGELSEKGMMRPDVPLAVSSRELMSAAVKNLHSETLSYEFNSSWLAVSPISVFWWAPDKSGFVIYSFSWCPLVVDYGALKDHDVSTFDDWTLDGDYIYRNFPDPNEIHIISDSDEVAYVSLTKESESHVELIPDRLQAMSIIGTASKINRISNLWSSSVMDPLKREIFDTPVYFHSGPLDRSWKALTRRTRRIIRWSIGKGNIDSSAWGKAFYAVGKAFFRAISWVATMLTQIAVRIHWLMKHRSFVIARMLARVGLISEEMPPWTDSAWTLKGYGTLGRLRLALQKSRGP